jgi:quercetin dioxygenase-like cupin family protein
MKKLIAFAIAVACAAPLAAQQRPESDASPVLGRERIRAEIPITTREGVRTLQVTQRNWSLAGGQAGIPDTGFLVVQLHSGEVVTTIEGNRQKRKPGEWWSVPEGAKWSVQVTSEMAVLQVTGISAPR